LETPGLPTRVGIYCSFQLVRLVGCGLYWTYYLCGVSSTSYMVHQHVVFWCIWLHWSRSRSHCLTVSLTSL